MQVSQRNMQAPQPQLILVDSRLNGILREHVLPKLGKGDLGRLACTRRSLRELATGADVRAWRAAVSGILPCTHPVLSSEAPGDLVAAIKEHKQDQLNATLGLHHCSPAVRDCFSPVFSPDGALTALLKIKERRGGLGDFILQIYQTATMSLVASVITEIMQQRWRMVQQSPWCRWSADGSCLKLLDVGMEPGCQISRHVFSSHDLTQCEQERLELPFRIPNSLCLQGPSCNGSYVGICDTDKPAASCMFAIIGGQTPPFRLGPTTRAISDIWHPHQEPLFAVPEQSTHGFCMRIQLATEELPLAVGPAHHMSMFSRLAWSPTGRSLAYLSFAKENNRQPLREAFITVIHVQTGQILFRLNLSLDAGVHPSLALSARGSVAFGIDRSLHVWHGQRQMLEHRIGSLATMAIMAFSPDGNFLMAARANYHGIFLFDARSSQEVPIPDSYSTAHAYHLAWDSTGTRIVMVVDDPTTKCNRSIKAITFKPRLSQRQLSQARSRRSRDLTEEIATMTATRGNTCEEPLA